MQRIGSVTGPMHELAGFLAGRSGGSDRLLAPLGLAAAILAVLVLRILVQPRAARFLLRAQLAELRQDLIAAELTGRVRHDDAYLQQLYRQINRIRRNPRTGALPSLLSSPSAPPELGRYSDRLVDHLGAFCGTGTSRPALQAASTPTTPTARHRDPWPRPSRRTSAAGNSVVPAVTAPAGRHIRGDASSGSRRETGQLSASSAAAAAMRLHVPSLH